MDKKNEALVKKIDQLLERIRRLKPTWWSSMGEGGFRGNTAEHEAVYTETISLIESIYGKGDPHYQRILYFYNQSHLHSLQQTEGLLIGTKGNIESGLLNDLKSKLLIDIKTDFLESAKVLLEEGQKDPAAVLACIVLEDSLKRLACQSDLQEAKDKEMGVVASMLLSKGVIEKSTNQSIQNFKNLRNAALHAEWPNVSSESVNLLLAFLPMFLDKHGI